MLTIKLTAPCPCLDTTDTRKYHNQPEKTKSLGLDMCLYSSVVVLAEPAVPFKPNKQNTSVGQMTGLSDTNNRSPPSIKSFAKLTVW